MCDCAGSMGGAGGPCYSNPCNICGMGDPVMGGFGGDLGNLGGPDRYYNFPLNMASKKQAGSKTAKKTGKSQSNSGYDMSPRPLIVPWNSKK